MKKRLAAICFAATLAIGMGAAGVRGDDGEASRATLKGITAVHVLVEDLDEDAQKIGLTKDSIQTDVELKLVVAGLHVVSREEWAKLPGAPKLYVYINVLPPQAASVGLELDQNVTLERNGQHVVSASTWNLTGVMANPSSQGIRNDIKNRVDRFLDAWMAANSQK